MKSFALLLALAGFTLAYPQHGDGHNMPKAGNDMPKAGNDMPKAGNDMPKGGHDMPQGGHSMPGMQHSGSAPPPGGHGGKGMEHAGHGAPPAKTTNIGKVEELKPVFATTNKRVRVTYGHYNLVGFNATAASENEGGMANASNKKAPKPCSDCTLKYAKVNLQHTDGKPANFASGAYLHHLTMAVVGPGRVDVACPDGTMRIPKNMERMLAVHNDRNETYFGLNGADKAGFYLGKEDDLDLELVLKNEVNTAKDVIFTIEWEYAPGKPAGWKEVKGIWMDVAPCSAMGSDINIPKGKSKFLLEGPEWTSTVNGRLLNTVGHGHDGVVEVQILLNGKAVCQSKADYSSKPEYSNGQEMVKQGAKANAKHISAYSPCNNIGAVKKGDKLKLTASYDLDTYAPLMNKMGVESHVMGVAMMFVEVDK